MDEKKSQISMQPSSRSLRLTAIIISAVILIAIAVCGIYWYQNIKFKNGIDGEKFNQGKITGDYQWKDKTLQSQYAKVSWNKITTSRLTGFSPNIPFTEKKTEGCGNVYNGSYLRIEGGLCGIGFWLEDSDGNKIDSREKLSNLFAPIDNEAEAMSFIAITQSNLKIDESGMPEGYTSAIDDGFLVQLVYNNMFGCGNHEPTGVIFKILKNGEINQIASEKEKPLKPGEPVLCVD
ncbi:MAG: hypothetical protein WC499_02245 [Patescibacteria group bacterium]